MKFNSVNPATSASEIESFEHTRGIRLPRDYVDFLLHTNGGQLNPNESSAEIPNWKTLLVQELFGITEDPSHSITNHRFTNFSDYVHQMMLEIGYDPLGQKLFMDLREGPNHGKIYIHAMYSTPNDPIVIDDTGFEDDGDYEQAQLMHVVADSFSDLVAMLGTAPSLGSR